MPGKITSLLPVVEPVERLNPSQRTANRSVVLRRAFYCLLVVVTVYFWFSPIMSEQIYDACLLRPEQYPFGGYDDNTVDGITGTDEFFNSTDGRHKLHGWFFRLPGAKRTVLISHGLGGNITTRTDVVALILESGASAFIYDYQGYGRSEGDASLTTICDDGLAAYSFLYSKMKVAPENIIVMGESLGTGVTCNLASRVPVARIILQSPFSCLLARCAEAVPLLRIYPSWFYPQSGLDNASILSHLHIPVLIVHGVDDLIIPVHHARDLFAAALQPKRLVLVPSARHSGDPALMRSPLYETAVREFIAATH